MRGACSWFAPHPNPQSKCESYPDLPRSRRRHTRDPAEIGLRDGQDRVVILQPVERIECLRANLQPRLATDGEGLRDCQVDAPAAGALYLRWVLCARPHCCPRDRVGRYLIVRGEVEVLQSIPPVVEHRLSAVVIGPAVADA